MTKLSCAKVSRWISLSLRRNYHNFITLAFAQKLNCW